MKPRIRRAGILAVIALHGESTDEAAFFAFETFPGACMWAGWLVIPY